MSEMVERVAESIWQAESVRADRGPRRVAWEEAGPPTWEKYLPLARAAIEAMREPTEAMKEAGERRLDFERGQLYQDVRTLYGRVFESMIAEALK